jgi:MFS family permease
MATQPAPDPDRAPASPKDKKGVIETSVPARLDRLPWSRWHVRVVAALGTTWLLDGLQVTLAGSLAGILEARNGLALSSEQVTAGATTYLIGAVIGAIFFGYLTDRLGRKKLFLVTLAVYSAATGATALSWNFFSFAAVRLVTGLGIGGEYAAINSAVDELIPGRVRGAVDLIVNATFWIGAAVGSVASLLLLNGHLVSPHLSWRLAFGTGAVLGFGVFFLRGGLPESPRWLMLRGREKEAEDIVSGIEEKVAGGKDKICELPKPEGEPLRIHPRDRTPWRDVFRNMLRENRQRSILALVLMVGQSFFFNAVFFTFGLVVKQFYGVTDQRIPLHLLPFALACFLGPLTLGRLFDKVGRKPMIALCYGISGAALIATVFPFVFKTFGVAGLDACFAAIFFVASSAASAAYLTVSEIFPLEIRAFAISIFYAIGTLVGGVGAPLLFGVFIASGSRWHVSIGYLIGAAMMLAGALCEWSFGVEAAGKSLESVSRPLQSS